MPSLRLACAAAFSIAVTLPVSPATAAPQPAALAFRIDEGRNINSFLRAGPVAAHLLLRSGTDPRILVAFPAGNSGVGLWFEKTAAPVTWTLVNPPKPLSARDARGRILHGIEFEVSVDASELHPRAAVMSSIRVLRDYELQRTAPAEVLSEPHAGDVLEWSRDRLDGAAGYRLTIRASATSSVTAQTFKGAARSPIRMTIQALTGEMPLTPLPTTILHSTGADPRARDALAFLGYREKFLAGSWRFDTYFGRDTLISALLLAPVLEPAAMQSAISSVLDRLAPNGEVAHEEDIGEFAVLRNAREGRGKVATPIYDYGMVDDDFMLAPLTARWLLDDKNGQAYARSFLAQRNAAGERHGDALARNLLWVVERTAYFADDPRAANLVGIKTGRTTGNWRDSDRGLAGGRFPYDVNVALIPSALVAISRLSGTGLLDPYLTRAQRNTLAGADPQQRVWAQHAPALFETDVSAATARDAIRSYAANIGVDSAAALRALGDGPLSFNALSLAADGTRIPILNSDEGFRLLLTDPAPDQLERCLAAILRPFPAGLLTDVGLLVANPALAGPDLQRDFTRSAYHGTVVWSWQQALLAAGLDRQLQRTDLPAEARTHLTQARRDLWAVIEKSRALRTSELWSWSYRDGQFHIAPFGASGADADESNAAQLWSTVYLGLTPPVAARP